MCGKKKKKICISATYSLILCEEFQKQEMWARPPFCESVNTFWNSNYFEFQLINVPSRVYKVLQIFVQIYLSLRNIKGRNGSSFPEAWSAKNLVCGEPW